MAKKYVKHDREVSAEDLAKYGKLATHDIHVPVLLLYPLGTIPDKNGTPVKIDEAFMRQTMTATNNFIKKRFDSPFAKVKSFIAEVINDYEMIPVIKNHKTDDVDGLSGHSKGLCYMGTVKDDKTGKDIPALFIDSIIKDPEVKSKINNDLFRSTSLGTRPDGSIKEISIVINEALAHGGFMLAEEKNDNSITEEKTTTINNINPLELQLAEEIAALELEEQQLDNLIIPNHMILSRMIKNSKIEPWKYNDLITQPTQTLQLMEHAMPSAKLGILYGTNKEPQAVNVEDIVVKKAQENYQKISGKKLNSKVETEPQQIEIIKQARSLEEGRHNELKHMLELAEYSSDILKKYISIELGETIEQPVSKDKYLMEYLNKSKEIKSKKNQLQIQLGEFNND